MVVRDRGKLCQPAHVAPTIRGPPSDPPPPTPQSTYPAGYVLILAHPLTEPGELLLPPLVVVTLVVSIVALVAQGRTHPAPPGFAVAPQLPLDRHLDVLDIVGRLGGVGLLAVAVLAGRFGSVSEFDNLASVLVVAFAWPALMVGSALLPTMWPRLNPWDGLARVLRARDGELAGDVRWALPAAFGWVAYLGVLMRPLAPQTVSVALAVYSMATIAACLVVGRIRWLDGGELFTVFFGWIGLRRGLIDWQPPRGAASLLGVLGGGFVFSALPLGLPAGAVELALQPLDPLLQPGDPAGQLGVGGLQLGDPFVADPHLTGQQPNQRLIAPQPLHNRPVALVGGC